MTSLLAVRDLRIAFQDGAITAVRGVSLDVKSGECLGVVGESGSGKSLTALAAMGLLPAGAAVTGSIQLEGQELLGLSDPALNRLRGARMGMIFQDPLTSLAPHLRVGEQIAAPLRAHGGLSRSDAWREARRWLDRVRIPNPDARLRQFPHELSGGMRQRVMIAAALAAGPKLLLADEPTTALDVTVQAEILDLLQDLRAETGAAILLISHDMGVMARMADRICVMRAGAYVEEGDAAQVLAAPRSDYAKALLAATPRLDGGGRLDRPRPAPVLADAAPVLEARDLSVDFQLRQGLLAPSRRLRAVDGVSFTLRRGETVGVVGESGSGKSTLARAALRLLPSAGAVSLMGEDISAADKAALRRARRDLQIVFQDPLGSLDPRRTVGQSVGEPLQVHRPDLGRAERDALVARWLGDVGLAPAMAARYPHQLSGGQAQRAGIARAMILEPKVVICDEAVSALDVSVRAQVIDLLVTLQARLGTAFLFISHDLAVVREVSHRVLVLYRGRVVEDGPAEAVLAGPRHPYTQALLSAVLPPDVGARAAVAARKSRPPPEGAPSPLIEVAPGHRAAI